MDLEAMKIKGYSAFPKTLALLVPHHQIFRVIPRTLVFFFFWRGGLTPLQRCSCFVQPQPTKLCVIVVSEFELSLRYHAHSWSKRYETPYFPSNGLNQGTPNFLG